MTLPDGTVRTWTYDPTFNQLTSYTDELGHQTLYEIDPANGNTLSMRVVFGQVDDPQNGETDDLVTSYTYTPRDKGDRRIYWVIWDTNDDVSLSKYPNICACPFYPPARGGGRFPTAV